MVKAIHDKNMGDCLKGIQCQRKSLNKYKQPIISNLIQSTLCVLNNEMYTLLVLLN